ncbi:MAG TPA: PH domain-containing protein [Candidatus Saccharimonadales bacterium]|nr:PH domain-containing protein [Candidatus Saccharimonadales bacterium]
MAEEKETVKSGQKYFDDQFDDEKVLFVFRKHPIVMRKGIILWAVGMLAGPLYTLALTVMYRNDPAKYPSPGFFFASLLLSIVLALMLFFPFWIGWYFSVFIVTDQRFIQITQKGLFHRAVADIGLSQIQSVNYEIAGLQETLLGFGTIKMQTYVGDLTIHEVHHPAKIQKKILNVLREAGVTTIPYQGIDRQYTNEDEETEEA